MPKKQQVDQAQWKLIGPRLIDVGHGITIEIKYIGDVDTYKSYYVEHVVEGLFTSAKTLYETCQSTLEQLHRMDSIRAAQAPVLNALRAAIGTVPATDDATLAFVLSRLDAAKK